MKQGQVKQEMSRVNMYVLEISELTWVGLGGFNSEDYYIYYKKQQLEIDMEQLLVPN